MKTILRKEKERTKMPKRFRFVCSKEVETLRGTKIVRVMISTMSKHLNGAVRKLYQENSDIKDIIAILY